MVPTPPSSEDAALERIRTAARAAADRNPAIVDAARLGIQQAEIADAAELTVRAVRKILRAANEAVPASADTLSDDHGE